jgi:HSP20 family protein
MARPTNPFTEFSRLFERMQDDFEEMARTWGGESELVPSSTVRVDLEDRDDEFVLTAELPGFDTDDIDVRVTDRTLHVEAEHTEETEEGEATYVRRERHRASVARSVSLPETVETDEISATYDNGVLIVRLPKSEPVTRGERIEVS